MIGWIMLLAVAGNTLVCTQLRKLIVHLKDFRKPFCVVCLSLCTIMFLCCSCGSSKSSSKQEVSIESGRQANRRDTTALNKQHTKVETADVIEETEEITTIYDTDKPADRSTGKPPVLSETKKKSQKRTNKKKEESSYSTLNHTSMQQSNDGTKIKRLNEEVKQRQETTVPGQIGGVFRSLVVLVAFAIAAYLVYWWRKQ